MKEIKADINRWRNITCSWIGRISIVKMNILSKAILQIQCNPYQTTSGILHRIRTKNFTICMETQKTPNSQSNLEKEKWSQRNQAPQLQTIPQSYSNQDSMGESPGDTVVKNPPASIGDTGSSPGPGRSHMLQSN